MACPAAAASRRHAAESTAQLRAPQFARATPWCRRRRPHRWCQLPRQREYGRANQATIRHRQMSDQCSADLFGVRVHRQTHLAPGATLGPAMLAHLPLAFAIDLQSGAVEHEVQRFFGTLRRQRDPESLRATAQRCVVRHGQPRQSSLSRLWAKPCSARSGRRKICLSSSSICTSASADAWAPPGAHLEFQRCSEKVGVNPHRYILSNDYPRVVLRPVLDAALALWLDFLVGGVSAHLPGKNRKCP